MSSPRHSVHSDDGDFEVLKHGNDGELSPFDDEIYSVPLKDTNLDSDNFPVAERQSEHPTSSASIEYKKVLRLALGQEASIGNLYDIRTDKVITRNLFKSQIPDDFVNASTNITMRQGYSTISSISEKFANLQVNGELKLSVLAGYVKPRGSFGFLEDLSSVDGDHVVLYQIVDVARETIDLNQAKECLDMSLVHSKATHVIVGIEYGLRTNIVMEKKLRGDETGGVEMIKRVSDAMANGALESGDFPDGSVPVKVFADVIPDGVEVPKTLHEALPFLREMAKVKDMKQIVPITLILAPISALNGLNGVKLPALPRLHAISPDETTKWDPIFDQLYRHRAAKMQLLEEATTNEKELSTALIDVVDEYDDRTWKYEGEFMKNFSATVQDVRMGTGDNDDLVVLRRGFTKNNDCNVENVSKIKKLLANYRQLTEVARKNNVMVLAELPLDARVGDVYVLFISFIDDRLSPLFYETIKLAIQLAQKNRVIMIDGDRDGCRTRLAEGISEGPRICLMRNGNYVCDDCLAMEKERAKKSFVMSVKPMVRPRWNTVRKVVVEIPCPGSIKGKCNKAVREWTCSECEETVEYDFEGYFYCRCGCGDVKDYRFKCCDSEHGEEFIEFEGVSMRKALADVKDYETVNILVIGETGVGKSTWINCIANYTAYGSLEEAVEQGIINLIPTSFPIYKANKDRFDKINVTVGREYSETKDNGESDTDEPRCYYFTHEKKRYCIIDTPGIGDTRGLERDRLNIERLLSFISSSVREIHLICFLLWPDLPRLTDRFLFCFYELIKQFHREAAKNIVFCFPRSHSTGYNMGSTHGNLQVELEAIRRSQSVSITLNRETCYMFDNMAYQYMCMKEKKVPDEFFASDTRTHTANRAAYEITRAETMRLLEYAHSVRPHSVTETVALHKTRMLVVKLSVPLSRISQAVQMTLDDIAEKRAQLEKVKNDRNELMKHLTEEIKVYYYKMTHVNTYVCKNCNRLEEVKGEEKQRYIQADPTIASQKALFVWVGESTVTEAYGRLQCKKCGPKFPSQKVTKEFCSMTKTEIRENKNVRQNIDLSRSNEDMYYACVVQDEMRRDDLLAEKNAITRASAAFAVFLEKHSIKAYNDATEQYLLSLIELESEKAHSGKACKKAVYESMLRDYMEEKMVFQRAKEGEFSHILSVSEIDLMIQHLKNLPHYGPNVKEVLETRYDAWCPPAPVVCANKKTGIARFFGRWTGGNGEQKNAKQPPTAV